MRSESDKGDTGVIVRVIVKERQRIGSVEYRGNKVLQTSKITEQLDKDKIDLHIGSTIEQTLVKRAAESIKKAYTENGYESVDVTTTTEDLPQPGEKKIVFNVNEGIKATVATIEFTGNTHFSSRRLRFFMKEVKPNGLISWIRKKNLYIPSKLDEDLENIKNLYQDYGYYDVSFGEPQILQAGTPNKPRLTIITPSQEAQITPSSQWPAPILQGQRQSGLQGQPGQEDRRHPHQRHRGREERRPVRRRLLRRRRRVHPDLVLDP